MAQKTERKKATLAAKFWKIEGDREGQERKGNEVRELEGLASHSKDFGFCSNCNGRSLEGFKRRNDTIWLRIWKFTSAYQVPCLIVTVQICLDFWLLIHHVVMCWRILLHLHWQWHNVISAEKDTYTPTSFKNIISIIRVCFTDFFYFYSNSLISSFVFKWLFDTQLQVILIIVFSYVYRNLLFFLFVLPILSSGKKANKLLCWNFI